ncbi:ChbG/HpnK family deacetylase, partial [Paenibacillus sp. TAF58]
TNLTTLTDEYGHFPSETATVIAKADPEELYEEAVAQIELALKMGIDPTNIDNHMGSMNHVTDCEGLQAQPQIGRPAFYSTNKHLK